MRLAALAVAAILSGAPAWAQQVQPSSPADAGRPELPVSLDRIRSALERPAAGLLKGLDERPHFRIEIRERQKIEELLATLKFDSGPAVPGGLYGYAQQQNLWSKVNNPLAQPYAAFSPGQMMTITLENLLGKYFGGRAISAVSAERRSRAEEAADQEVTRALEEFWASQSAVAPRR